MLEWTNDDFSIEKSADLALCAEAAYLGPLSMRKFCKTHNIEKYENFDNDGAQGFIAVKGDITVIAFRGTEPKEIGDILADLNALPKKSMTDGWVHSGFRGELDKLWNDMLRYLKKNGTKRVYFTGHSLGAAMATIACSRWPTHARLYNYGSPRAGTMGFADLLDARHESHRFVNNNDIVTKVPMAIMGYRHIGKLHYINHHGKLREMSYWQRIKDQWRGRLRAWQKGQPFDGAFDHSMTLYSNKLNSLRPE